MPSLLPQQTPRSWLWLRAISVRSNDRNPKFKPESKALAEYLQREQAGQPLHNRLALLWASSKLPGIARLPWELFLA
jgi:hypothetical protein